VCPCRPARSYGDSEGDGEASVVAAFLVVVVVVFFAVVTVLEVAAVSCFCAQEVTNAMPINVAIKDKTDFFIPRINCHFRKT
jgi:hypothetical protein